jgi:hypothetical protein
MVFGSLPTTVEIKRNTARLLEEMKQKYKAKSADETIRKLIEKAEKCPRVHVWSSPEDEKVHQI